MTLPQQNIASARPTSFYYLMCQLDRVQYRMLLKLEFKFVIINAVY